MKLLSICIPIRNRHEELASTLSQITRQVEQLEHPHLVEVVVSDNGSDYEIFKKNVQLARKYKNVRFHFHNADIGSAENMIDVVKRATGKYAWIMGDDDKLKVHAIKTAIETIRQYPVTGCYLCNYNRMSDDSKALSVRTDKHFKNGHEYVKWAMLTRSKSEWDALKLTYYNSLIVRRAEFLKFETFSNSDVYRHAEMLHHLLARWRSIHIIAKPLVLHNNMQQPNPMLAYHWLALYFKMGKIYNREWAFTKLCIIVFLANLKYRVFK